MKEKEGKVDFPFFRYVMDKMDGCDMNLARLTADILANQFK